MRWVWQMDYVWYVIKEIKKDEIEDEIDENGRIESIGSSACLTAYDDTNLKISKESGMLGWRDRPSKLSVGDYVFVYNSETDTIETCFEIKSLSSNKDPFWHEESNLPSSEPVYQYHWNAIVKADSLGVINDIIFGFGPFKSDKKNF